MKGPTQWLIQIFFIERAMQEFKKNRNKPLSWFMAYPYGYGAMCPQQIYSARSLSRIFQEDLEVFLD
jgi:hypothetical protein